MSRRALILAATAATAASIVGAGYAYDRSRADLIASGVSVAGVEIGGLRATAARARIERELLAPLSQAVAVEAAGQHFRLTAREARLGANPSGMVDAALARSRRGSIVERIFRGLRGERIEARLPGRTSFSRAAVVRLVDRVRHRVERAPRDAAIRYVASGLRVDPPREGLRIDRRALRRRIEARLSSADRTAIVVATERVAPRLGTKALARSTPWAIVVDRGRFRLRLYHALGLHKTYRISVGQVGLETPAGLYRVQNKAVNPAWHVPRRPWAGKLAGKVIPGGTPKNPIKARWLGIFEGAGIHGTDATSSLGRAASHGCVRMAIPDVIEVYDQVGIGAPIFVA